MMMSVLRCFPYAVLYIKSANAYNKSRRQLFNYPNFRDNKPEA